MLVLCGNKSKELTDAEEARDNFKQDLKREKDRVETLTKEFVLMMRKMEERFDGKLSALHRLEQTLGEQNEVKVKDHQTQVNMLNVKLARAKNQNIESRRVSEQSEIQNMEMLNKRLSESELRYNEDTKNLKTLNEQLHKRLEDAENSHKKSGWKIAKLLSALHSLKLKAVRAVGKKQEKVVALEKRNTELEAQVELLQKSVELKRASIGVKEVEDVKERMQYLHNTLVTSIDKVSTYGNQLVEIVAHLEAASPNFRADRATQRKNIQILDRQVRKKVWELIRPRGLKRVTESLREEMQVEILGSQVELIQLKLKEAKLDSTRQSELCQIEKAELASEVNLLTTKIVELKALLKEKTEIADDANEKLTAMSRQQDKIIREHTKQMKEKLDAAISLSSIYKKKVSEMAEELHETRKKIFDMGEKLEGFTPSSQFYPDHDVSSGEQEKRLQNEEEEFEGEVLCTPQLVSLNLKKKLNTGSIEEWLQNHQQKVEVEQLSLDEELSFYCDSDPSEQRPLFENSRQSGEETRLDSTDVMLVTENEIVGNDLQVTEQRHVLLRSAFLNPRKDDDAK